MPQEISVSYLAIKNKVYKLVDAVVAGEKSEADVQDSVRRWWSLIHPADRPIAKKYLLTVLGRSMSALEAIADSSASASGSATPYPSLSSEPMRVPERVGKDAGVPSAV